MEKEQQMRKIRLLLLIFCLIISCLFAFASCDKTEVLDAPKGLEIEQTTLTLNWKGVVGARLYTISITKDGGEPREVIGSKNYYLRFVRISRSLPPLPPFYFYIL